MSGSATALGKWDNETAVELHRSDGSSWQADVSIKKDEFSLRYKYILKNRAGDVVPELGADRELGLDTASAKPSAMIVASDGYFRVRRSSLHVFLLSGCSLRAPKLSIFGLPVGHAYCEGLVPIVNQHDSFFLHTLLDCYRILRTLNY